MLEGLKIDRSLRDPVSSQIASYLRLQIQSRKLKPGHRLPTTVEVVKGIGVGTHTVHDALAQLEKEGLVEINHGHGTFVSDNAPVNTQKLRTQGKRQKLTRIALSSAFPNDNNGSYRENSVRGIMAECARLGLAETTLPPQMAFSSSPEALHEYLLESNCDGLVWLYLRAKDWVKVKYLADAGFPVVVTSRSHLANGIACVECDELGAGLVAGNHMADKGCKELLVFSYFNGTDIDTDDKMYYPFGFREGLKTVFDRRSNLDSADIKIVHYKDMEGENAVNLKDILKRISDDCGVIVTGGSESFYMALLENMKLLGWHEMISLCPHSWAMRFAPIARDANFSVLVIPFEEVARCAVQKLVGIIEGKFENTATLINYEFSDYLEYWHSRIA